MALRTLMLKKELDQKRKALRALLEKDAEFETRNAEIEAAIGEAETEEEKAAVKDAIDAFEAETAAHEAAKTDLDEEVRNLENELDELEKKNAPAPAPAGEPEARKDNRTMNMKTRKVFRNMNREERTAMIQREDVQAFLSTIRTGIREKRAVSGVGSLIPEVVLPLLRENILEYSKLYKHVNIVAVSGEGRQPVMGTIPEAVWTDCCAALNELDLGFNETEVNCWRVAGFYALCNANIEDSDIDLLAEIIVALGASIGLALDKAILYGTGTRMPLGVVTRLAQTEKPADYPDLARTWVDLHTKNIKAINSASMSAKAISVDANGNIVTGILDRMPVIGGIIEVLDFVPDNVIIGGFFDLYLLGERSAAQFATSEHVRFLQDQTVMRGTARYDGKPAIAEGFVAIGINNTTPTAAMDFAPDTANAEGSES